MRRSLLAFLFAHVAVSGCGKSHEDAIRAEPARSDPTVRADEQLLTDFQLRVPSHCTYIQHGASAASAREIRIPTEETSNAQSDAAGTTFLNVYTERPSPPEPESAGTRTWRLDARGFLQLSQKSLRGLDPAGDSDFDPPVVLVPPSLIDGATWEKPYPGQRSATVTLRRSSHFCPGGFRLETSVTVRKGISKLLRSHYCPNQGWRGDESVYFANGQVQGWTWTSDLVADGEHFADPPLARRFPEGAPPDVP